MVNGPGPAQRLKRVTSIPLYRNALFLIASGVITTSLGFFFWMTVARLYTTTEVGLGSAIIAAMNLIALFSVLGLNFSIIRFLPHAARPQELINSAFTLTGLVALVVAAIFIAGTDLWAPPLGVVKSEAIFVVTFLALAVLTTWSMIMNSVFVGGRRAVFVLGKDTTLSILKIALVAAFASFLHTFGVIGSWTVALGIALALSALVFLPRVIRGYRPVPALNLSRIGSLRRYAAGNYVASLFTRVPILILPLIVVTLLGTESNAYFYVAWMIAGVVGSATRSISGSLFAEGAHSPEDIGVNVARAIRLTLVVTVPAMIAVVAAGKWILLAFGPDYSTSALGLLWLLAISSLPRGVIHVYSGLLRAQDRLRELLVLRSLIAVAVLALSSLLLPAYGIISVGYVWLGVHVLASIAVAPRLAGQAGRPGSADGADWEDVDNL